MSRAILVRALAPAFVLLLGLGARPAAAQVAPYRIAAAELAIDGLSAEVDGASPVVPKNMASGIRVVVRAGGVPLSAEEALRFLGPGFQMRAELSGPGLPRALSLPDPEASPSEDPLLLLLPPLPAAGDYTLSGLRFEAAGRTLLDIAPRQLTLTVIEQILVTSVRSRPLTRAELEDRGVLIDADAYLGFEFTIGILLESRPLAFSLPVVFNRRGLPTPPSIPLPPPIRRAGDVQIIPILFEAGAGEGQGEEEGGGGGGGGGGGSLGGEMIPSVLVIPGRVGYLKAHFSTQLFVANGAPGGSALTVRDVTGTIHLPPGLDGVGGTADDPLILAPLVEGTPSPVLPVRGVGPDGEPGTADDVGELAPAALGQAEFVLRGEREGFHNLDFDIQAVLEGLPTGPVPVTGKAKGGVLVRNPRFHMAFTLPDVVRVHERFKLVATVTNIGRSDAQDLSVSLDQAQMSGLRLHAGTGTVTIPTLAAGDARTVEFEFESQRTGKVVASYLHFDGEGTGRLNFTVGIGERGVVLSPDTLVLPTSVDLLPPGVVAAAHRVLGQAWSVAQSPEDRLPSSVLAIDGWAVRRKLMALSEAALRVQLGQPVADAVRDIAFDFYGGGDTPDPGFDQLLRQTEAGRNLAYELGMALAGPAAAAGGPAVYERAASEIWASGSDFVAFSVRGTGEPVGAILTDAAGRKTVLGRSTADYDVAQSEVPGAAFLPLGPPATAPHLGLVAAPAFAPYTLTVAGPAEVSVTFPRGDGTFQHGTVTTAYAARIVMDFTAPDAILAREDTDGDGTYDAPRELARQTLSSQGPRLVSATVVGPETLRTANLYGVHLALVFDRLVDEAAAAEKDRYQIPSNEALSAKRQLSGRMVFLGLAQPEGNYVSTTLSVTGLPDTRGVVGPAGTVPVTSRLVAPGAVVSGRVINADGTPFTGGPVFYSQYTTQHSCLDVFGWILKVVAVVRPDADGRYEFRYVARDPCGMPFEMAVYDPVTAGKRSVELRARTAGERMVADLAVMGRGTVTGIVRDAAGAPVGGARVVALSVTDTLVGGADDTDGDGRYIIPNVTVGGVNVRAGKDIYVGQAAGRIERAGGTAHIDVRLEGGSARLSGRVFVLEDGVTRPAPGLYVQYRLVSDLSRTLLGVARTDGEGRYALSNMPAGNYQLEAYLNLRDRAGISGHADEGQTIENLDLVIVVPPEEQLGSVRGTVRFKSGQPAAGVIVTVLSRGTLTGPDGTYAIGGLAVPSNPAVTARTQDGIRYGNAYAFLTASNPNPTGIDITLSGDGDAVFTVLDVAGNPIVGQIVRLDGSCGNPCGCASRTTNAQGQVRFEGLRLGTSRVGRALRFVDGAMESAEARVRLDYDGQTVYGVLRFLGTGTVRGVVFEAGTTHPVHGARVQVEALRFFQDEYFCGMARQFIDAGRTDENGGFELPRVNVGGAKAVATQEFYGGSIGSAGGTVVRGQVLNLTISLANRMAGSLSGTVFLPDGETHAEAGVQVTVNGMLPDVTVGTDELGYYEFAEILPEGYYTLTVRDPDTGGVARQRIYLRAQQDAVHDVRLLGLGAVEVTVADGGDEVVETANVRLRQTEYPHRTFDGVVQPAAGGVVHFEGVPEGPFVVEASDAFGRGGRASGQITRPDEVAEVRVRLTVTGSVVGHFVMPGGAPIPFGTVKLTAGGLSIGQVTTQGSGGDLGAFSFDYVPAGAVRLDAEDPATARTGLAVGSLESEDQELVLDVRAQALGTVRGLVTGDGTPQPGALVKILSGTYRVHTAADSEGWYEVPGVPEGRITVTASLEGGYLKATASGTLTGEGGVLQLDVALLPTGEVRGTVVESDGETPARAEVTAIVATPLGGSVFTHHTSADGAFDFTRVVAGPGWLRAWEFGSIDRAAATMTVPAGGIVEVPLHLNGVGSLRGRALASDGSATGGYLSLINNTGAYPWSFWVRLGPDGLFHLPEVLAGPFTASLRVDGQGFALYGSVSGTITPGQETVLDVQVQASGTVTGRVMRAGGMLPAFGAIATLQHQRGTVRAQAQDDGRFTFRGVPLGSFTLLVEDDITTGHATVRNQQVVSNGQTVDLGTIELDATPPSITVIEPADGSSRPAIGGLITFDVADASGIDAPSLRVYYGTRWDAPSQTNFTFDGSRATGQLNLSWLAVGPNVLRFQVKDLAGNLTEKTITYTATGGTIQGRVRRHNGSPLPGAQVAFGPATAIADAQGFYVRGGLRPGGYFGRATDPATGVASGYQSLSLLDGDTRTVDFTLPAAGRITGVVLHADSTPAPGAQVSVWGRPSVTSGADGSYDLGTFAVGSYQISAIDARQDRAVATVAITLDGQILFHPLRLNGIGTVTVTVRNSDGTTVSGAMVQARSSSPLGWSTYEQPTVAGTTVFTQALAGVITADARDPVRNLAGQATGLLTDNGNLALTVTLEPAATVAGTVYRAGGTVPAADVDVTFSAAGSASRTMRTNAQGQYSFPNVRLTAFELLARDPANGDFVRENGVASTGGSTVTMNLTLRGVGQVRVIVRKATGEPAAGASVTLTVPEDPHSPATTEADGTVSFANVLAGPITADATLPLNLGSGSSTATLAPGQSLDVVVTLEPVGEIRGRVFAADGVTAASGVLLRIYTSQRDAVYATSAANGDYVFPAMPFRGGYYISALVGGQLRAQTAYFALTAANPVAVRDIVLVGVGTISGRVTDPAGQGVVGASVLLQLSGLFQGPRTTTSATNGSYTLADVPVGPFALTASRPSPNQRVDRTGEINYHGEALTIDLQLLANSVTLPRGLTDGNALTWDLQTDGSMYGARVVGSQQRAPKLTLVENGTPRPFAGGGISAAAEEEQREVVIRQTSLAGLTVTRKIFVPTQGYFVRILEILENPGTTPVTVDVLEESVFGPSSYNPSVVDSASGDVVAEPTDDWVMVDDPVTLDIYTASGQFAPLGLALSGPGGLRPTVLSWDGSNDRLTYRWNSVTVLPGQRAAFLHVMTPQADRARGRASAVRLAQLPPELLFGLAPEEGAAVRNFVVPADLVSAVPALPPNDGVVGGRVLGGDGQTIVPGAPVLFRSRSPHYGQIINPGHASDANGVFHVPPNHSAPPPLLVPRTDFDLTVSIPDFGEQTATIGGSFRESGLRNLAGVAGRTIVVSSQATDAYAASSRAVDGYPATHWRAVWGDSAGASPPRTPFFELGLPGDATVHEVHIRCSNEAAAHVLRRARVDVKAAGGAVLWSGEADLPVETCSGAVVPESPVAGARSVRVTSLQDGGSPTIAELEILGEGDFGPSRRADQDLPFSGRGVLEGRMLRADGSAIVGGTVNAAGNHVLYSPTTDANGFYRFRVVPPGSHLLTGEHPLRGHTVTVPNVAVAAGQKTTQDIVFPSMGRLTGATFSASGQGVNGTHALTVGGAQRSLGPAGTYTFVDLPPGTYTLTSTDARNQAQVSTPVVIAAEATTTQNVTFPPMGTVNVTATVDGNPLNNANAVWTSSSGPSSSGWTSVTGQRTFLNVPGPTITVKVTHPGNPNSFGTATVAMPSEGATVSVSVDVPGIGSVGGTVRSLNGVAMGGALVNIYSATDGTQYGASVISNPAGGFSLANIPERPFRLVARLSDSQMPLTFGMVPGGLTAHGQTLTLDALAPRGVLTAAKPVDLWEYTLTQGQVGGFTASGLAFGQDTALADPRVEVYGPDGTLVAANDDLSATNRNAQVVFDAAQAGAYVAVVKGAGVGGYHLGYGFDAWNRAFRRYPGASVTGHVVREGSGTPLASATVRLSATTAGGLSTLAFAATQPDGSYRFDVVPTTATVTVELLVSGKVVSRVTGATGAAGTTLDLPVVRPGLGQVQITTRYRGAAFAGVPVELTSSNTVAPPNLTSQSGTTGADGRWVATLVPGGTVTARATDPLSGTALESSGTLADGASLSLELALLDGPDTTPPATVTDLLASTPSLGTIRLAWTAPGDDGSAGTAAAYDLRYATWPINGSSFAAATVAPSPTPAAGGSAQVFDLTALAPDTTYYFALKARDEALNWSDLSNVVQATTTSVPAAGLKLWLKADAGVGLVSGTSYVSSWQDQSGNNNHATQATATAQPLQVLGQLNGKPVLHLDGTTDWLAFTTRIPNVRTAVWVIREEPGVANGSRYLLGDTAAGNPWRPGAAHQMWLSTTSANVLNGETRLNGAVVNGTTTNRPTSMAVVTVVTAGDVPAANFARDSGATLNPWWGDLAELILYDRPLSDTERASIEAYLARKYALYVPALPAPSISPNGGTIGVTTHVTLQVAAAADIRYTLDGTTPTETSALYTEPLAVSGRTTVKAKAFASGWNPSPVSTATFLAADDYSPASVAGLRLWLRADAGASGSSSARVDRWTDQSGQGNDLTQADVFFRPVVLADASGGLPALRFDGTNDWLGFTMRLTGARTVFWVVREDPASTGAHYLLGDTAGAPWRSGTPRLIWNTGATSPDVLNGFTRINSAVVNGGITNRPTVMSVMSVVTTGPVPAANFARDPGTALNTWWGELAELVIYDTALLDADRRAVEEYLAARYGIVLP